MFLLATAPSAETENLSLNPRCGGAGILELSWVAGRTVATRVAARSPLKLLTPTRRTPAAWVYAGTFGGGLLAGDEIDLRVRVGPRAMGVLGTQASTKVYCSPGQVPCRQKLSAHVDEDGLLVLAPDPITCFAQAHYEQSQSIQLHGSGSLVLVDWLTSGRRARGECWAFSRYRSRLEVYGNDELLLADALLLDPADGPLDSPFRLGRFHCLAMLLLIGEQVAAAGEALLSHVAAKPVEPRTRLIDVASRIPQGIVLRVIGETTEAVACYLSQSLSFLNQRLGDGPWARKW